MGTSVASRLEEMRRTGGDKWLSLLNTKRSTTDTDNSVSTYYCKHCMGKIIELYAYSVHLLNACAVR